MSQKCRHLPLLLLPTVLLVPTCTYPTTLANTCSIPFIQSIQGKTKRTNHLASPSLSKRRRRDSNSSTPKIIANFKGCFFRGWTWQVGFESFCRYAVFVGEVSEKCRKEDSILLALAISLYNPYTYCLVFY